MRKRAEKALSVISGILIALFLMLATFSLAITIFYSAKGEDAVLFGCQYRIVLSGSMAPEIKEGDMVAVRFTIICRSETCLLFIIKTRPAEIKSS